MAKSKSHGQLIGRPRPIAPRSERRRIIMGILGAVGQIAGGVFGGPIGSMIGGAVGGAIEGNGGGSGGGEASQAFEAELQKAIGMMSVQPLTDIMDMGREALEEEEDS
jgi:hypothetical protein